MTPNTSLLLAVLVTILIGWSDTFFFGTASNSSLSFTARQIIHLVAYTLVFYVGYLYWKRSPQKWIMSLWLLSHFALLIVVVLFATLRLINPDWAKNVVAHFVITLRNMATGPLPLLAFYVLYRVQNKIAEKA